MIKTIDNNIEKSGNIIKITKGSGIATIITIVLLIIYSILLTYTSISESTIPTVVIVITGISILIGSQISANHIKRNGLLNGGLVGLIYILILYVISSIITRNFGFNMYSIIMVLISAIAGILGGIIGVNKRNP